MCDGYFNFKKACHKLCLNIKYNNEDFAPTAMECN